MSVEWVNPLGDTWVCPWCRQREHGRCLTAGNAHLCACDRRDHKPMHTSSCKGWWHDFQNDDECTCGAVKEDAL